MKKFAAALLVVVCSIGAANEPNIKLKAEDLAGDLSGIYKIVGQSPQGEEYRGTLTLEAGPQGMYLAFWTTRASTIPGVGHRKGDTITFGWGTQAIRGLTVYTVEKGKTLRGRYLSLPGVAEWKEEVATFLGVLED